MSMFRTRLEARGGCNSRGSDTAPASLHAAVRAAIAACAVALGGCQDDTRAPPLETYVPEQDPCEVAEPPRQYFHSEVLEGAEYWSCSPPREGSGALSFSEMRGTRAMVTGGVARFSLGWEGDGDLAGREIVMWVGALAKGFFTFTARSNDNPQLWQLQVDPSLASGDYDVYVGISEGRDELLRPIIGQSVRASLQVIQVGTGDIQVNLNWDTTADMDLWVIEPSGEAVYWGERESASGGRLDLDSYAACSVERDIGRGNENVYWPLGAAPSGEYSVIVEMFAPCETLASGDPTHYSVTIVSGDRSSTHEGTFEPSEDNPRHEVATFTF